MTTSDIISRLRAEGTKVIRTDGEHDHPLFPQQYQDVVFRQTFEYEVTDFEAEVGFYAGVFGFPVIAMTDDYALFTHPDAGYCLSFRKDDSVPAHSRVQLKLLFMTTDILATDTHLQQTGLVPDREIRKGSPVQDVIHFATPAGVAVEIWQMPTK